MSDMSIYKGLEFARLSDNADVSNAAGTVSQAFQRDHVIAGANLSATTENFGPLVPFAAVLKSAKLVTTGGNAVANATDYGVVNINKHSNGGAAVVMATANLANLAVTKWVPIAFTLVSNGANTAFAASDLLSVSVTNTGNGVANNLAYSVEVLWEDI